VIPVAETFNDYAKTVAAELKARDIRVSLELGDSRMNAKIRDCQTRKVPYMLVLGQREQDDAAVSVRARDGTQIPSMKVADFAAYVENKAATRALDL
jgi:threonyl-tRNA synthetase